MSLPPKLRSFLSAPRNATSSQDRFLESSEGVNGKDLIVNAHRRHIYLIADFGLHIIIVNEYIHMFYVSFVATYPTITCRTYLMGFLIVVIGWNICKLNINVIHRELNLYISDL